MRAHNFRRVRMMIIMRLSPNIRRREDPHPKRIHDGFGHFGSAENPIVEKVVIQNKHPHRGKPHEH